MPLPPFSDGQRRRMAVRVLVLFLGLEALAAGAMAKATPAPAPGVLSCLEAASKKHGIDLILLKAIAWQESSFNPSAIRRPFTAGGNGTEDYGLMQINSGWLPFLRSYGIRKEDLFNPCVNADVGAWILASNFRRLGVTWDAVGAYNAVTHWKRVRYATGVFTKAQALKQRNPSPGSGEQGQVINLAPSQSPAMAVYEDREVQP